ncbi:hypothetical protein RFI_26214, partial [Reticulomyxa filosa]
MISNENDVNNELCPTMLKRRDKQITTIMDMDNGNKYITILCFVFTQSLDKYVTFSIKQKNGNIIYIVYLYCHNDSNFCLFFFANHVHVYNLCVNGFIVVSVGYPGTSKTLYMCQSKIDNFRTRLNKKSIDLKALHVVSQSSKDLRIKKRWNQAMRHSKVELVKPLLLLDEIGLAEHSKHFPLKVLHHLLENPKISLAFGCCKNESNWGYFYVLIRYYMRNEGVMRNLGGYRDPRFQKCLKKVFRK